LSNELEHVGQQPGAWPEKPTSIFASGSAQLRALRKAHYTPFLFPMSQLEFILTLLVES
jgi:hypothetical protein